MSNRTDFKALSEEVFDWYLAKIRRPGFFPVSAPEQFRERIETELHNAYVAGEEGNGCGCSSCVKISDEDEAEKLWWVLEVINLNDDEIRALSPATRDKLVKYIAPLVVQETLKTRRSKTS